MIGFSTFILRDYYAAIGWNEDNLYSSITRSSSALLDFQIPQSLILQLANSPTPIFFTSYALDALPQLNGSISYITTSEPLEEIGPSRTIAFRDVVERFRVFPPPKRPVGKDEVWLGGRRVEGRDYLFYSRLHLPSLHLSGLATTRLTPTLQAHLAFLSQPAPPSPTRPTSPHSPPSHSRQPSEPSTPAPSPPTPGNILLSLQHDTGRYSGEYTYSAQDGMFGLRGLYNFGWQGGEEQRRAIAVAESKEREIQEGKRIDEEEMMEGGLRGRFSAGGEVYFSAKQRSFGISTGLRFTTIPPTLPLSPNSPPPSPPTTLTLLYNPLIGFLSSAYSAQVSPTVALSTRFGVNVYSYESDLSIGGEWWIGRRRGKRDSSNDSTPTVQSSLPPFQEDAEMEERRKELEERRKALSGTSLREDEKAERELDSPIPLVTSATESAVSSRDVKMSSQPSSGMEEDRDGVLKARLTGNWSIALLYEARIRKVLVSVGIISDLASRQRPIRSVGLEVQYFS
ncbi:mitochondrial distribution and morphology protein 10 [Kwoniella shandongensis]|uniref:Mitochondrial distribution and morphology protein 10 n=1 Tax=Kwoniella shandongensis TaxID=1734106 RepID=A0A5M6BU59_9TREE|nr:mitochondrial distribution and morphology protein 10 [Kwoniella shandongensis]KAA5525610.1 mitochondrial distribution and morphology protein 10 [Kwoniella shandongensis]